MPPLAGGDSMMRANDRYEWYEHSNAEMEVQEDTVYVSGLPPETTVDNLGELFGSIGIIKVSILKKLI
jgi:RNA recognition motif-containing protein